MSAIVSIGVNGPESDPVVAKFLAIDSGERFITLDLGASVSLTLHSYDIKAVEHARAIAKCLTDVADELERSFEADPPIPEPVTTIAEDDIPY